MASMAGNKRRHNEHTLDVKSAVLMEIDRRLSNKEQRCLQKIQCPKKHPAHMEKEQKK